MLKRWTFVCQSPIYPSLHADHTLHAAHLSHTPPMSMQPTPSMRRTYVHAAHTLHVAHLCCLLSSETLSPAFRPYPQQRHPLSLFSLPPTYLRRTLAPSLPPPYLPQKHLDYPPSPPSRCWYSRGSLTASSASPTSPTGQWKGKEGASHSPMCPPVNNTMSFSPLPPLAAPVPNHWQRDRPSAITVLRTPPTLL